MGVVKNIKIRRDSCTICMRCALACAQRQGGSLDPAKSAIRVTDYLPDSFKVKIKKCIQCPQEYCVKACSLGALKRDEETGIVQLDKGTCKDCRDNFACVKACKAGLIFSHPEMVHPLKCDLCQGDPRCVKECVSGTLSHG